jgi:hypothetical protein
MSVGLSILEWLHTLICGFVNSMSVCGIDLCSHVKTQEEW